MPLFKLKQPWRGPKGITRDLLGRERLSTESNPFLNFIGFGDFGTKEVELDNYELQDEGALKKRQGKAVLRDYIKLIKSSEGKLKTVPDPQGVVLRATRASPSGFEIYNATARGDSGGPAFANGILYGIVTASGATPLNDNERAQTELPAANNSESFFVSIPDHYDWIIQSLEKLGCNKCCCYNPGSNSYTRLTQDDLSCSDRCASANASATNWDKCLR